MPKDLSFSRLKARRLCCIPWNSQSLNDEKFVAVSNHPRRGTLLILTNLRLLHYESCGVLLASIDLRTDTDLEDVGNDPFNLIPLTGSGNLAFCLITSRDGTLTVVDLDNCLVVGHALNSHGNRILLSAVECFAGTGLAHSFCIAFYVNENSHTIHMLTKQFSSPPAVFEETVHKDKLLTKRSVITSLAVHPHRDILAYGTADGVVVIADAAQLLKITSQALQTEGRQRSESQFVEPSLSPAHDSASDAGEVGATTENSATLLRIHTASPDTGDAVRKLLWSRSVSATLAAVGKSGSVRLWDIVVESKKAVSIQPAILTLSEGSMEQNAVPSEILLGDRHILCSGKFTSARQCSLETFARYIGIAFALDTSSNDICIILASGPRLALSFCPQQNVLAPAQTASGSAPTITTERSIFLSASFSHFVTVVEGEKSNSAPKEANITQSPNLSLDAIIIQPTNNKGFRIESRSLESERLSATLAILPSYADTELLSSIGHGNPENEARLVPEKVFASKTGKHIGVTLGIFDKNDELAAFTVATISRTNGGEGASGPNILDVLPIVGRAFDFICFGNEEFLLALSLNGDMVSLYHSSGSDGLAVHTFRWNGGKPLQNVVPLPSPEGDQLLLVSSPAKTSERASIQISKLDHDSTNGQNGQLQPVGCYYLNAGEVVKDVKIQTKGPKSTLLDDKTSLIAVLTSQRLLVLSQDLNTLSQISSGSRVDGVGAATVVSMCWALEAVMYTTDNGRIYYLATNQRAGGYICSINLERRGKQRQVAILHATLSNIFIAAYNKEESAFQIETRPINPFEILSIKERTNRAAADAEAQNLNTAFGFPGQKAFHGDLLPECGITYKGLEQFVQAANGNAYSIATGNRDTEGFEMEGAAWKARPQISLTIKSALAAKNYDWAVAMMEALADQPSLQEYVSKPQGLGPQLPEARTALGMLLSRIAAGSAAFGNVETAIRCLDVVGLESDICQLLMSTEKGLLVLKSHFLAKWKSLSPHLFIMASPLDPETTDTMINACCLSGHSFTKRLHRRGGIAPKAKALPNIRSSGKIKATLPPPKPLIGSGYQMSSIGSWSFMASRKTEENKEANTQWSSTSGRNVGGLAVPPPGKSTQTLGPSFDDEDAVVGYWRYDEGSLKDLSQPVRDVSKRGNHGALVGTEMFVYVESTAPVDRGDESKTLKPYDLGFGIDLDDDHSDVSLRAKGLACAWGVRFDIAQGGTLDIGFHQDDQYRWSLTFESWLKREPGSKNGVLLMRAHGDSLQWWLLLREDTLIFESGSSIGAPVKSSIQVRGDGRWHHIALTLECKQADKAFVSLYVDGEAAGDGSVVTPSKPNAANGALFLGPELTKTWLAESRLWATVRSLQKIMDMKENYLNLAEMNRRPKQVVIHQSDCACEGCVKRRATGASAFVLKPSSSRGGSRREFQRSTSAATEKPVSGVPKTQTTAGALPNLAASELRTVQTAGSLSPSGGSLNAFTFDSNKSIDKASSAPMAIVSPRVSGAQERSSKDDNPTKLWKQFKGIFEAGDFIKAMATLDHCLDVLARASRDASDSLPVIQKQIKQCVKYRLATRLLMEMEIQEERAGKVTARSAALSTLVANVLNSSQCLEVASRKNLAIENYGITASLLQRYEAVSKQPLDPSLQHIFNKCKEESLANNGLEVVSCPSCHGDVALTDSSCSHCKVSFATCYQSLSLAIDPKTSGANRSTPQNQLCCSFCPAIYGHPPEVQKTSCTYCRVGSLAAVSHSQL